MTKINIVSGFLGAGKTTLIKKLLKEAFINEKVVLIENEFGEIGVDGGFMKEAGIEIKEMNSGCICCSLVGDFELSLKEVIHTYAPDRVIIEPSGVGKLSDIVKAVRNVDEEMELDGAITVVDAKKVKMYQKNFGEFYNDQLTEAHVIVMSHTQNVSSSKLDEAMHVIREYNDHAKILVTDWEELSGEDILALANEEDWVLDMEDTYDHECECHHEHHHHDEECECHHEHHHHDEECGCHHEHHHHDEECGCHHEHHHHDEECGCHHEHHHHDEECGCHHEHHHADEVFETWGIETSNVYDVKHLEDVLDRLANHNVFGMVVRAKGIVKTTDDRWAYFDVVPQEVSLRFGDASYSSRICVIGTDLDKEKLQEVLG